MRAEQEHLTDHDLTLRLHRRLPRRLVEKFAGAFCPQRDVVRVLFFTGRPILTQVSLCAVVLPYHDDFPSELDIAKLCLMVP